MDNSLFPQNDFTLLGVVLGFPLLGAAVNGIWGKRLGPQAVRFMALAATIISFLASVATLFALDRLVAASAHVEGGKTIHEHVKVSWTVWEWMHASGGRTGNLSIPIDVKFSVDALSSVMMLVITGIGSLIHLYATKYMEGDDGYHRFFCYLNLFVFAMLTLVMADNLPVLFIGWEGVGLCSYLLIGFWYKDGKNTIAGKKAFIANRIGDFGLICAMFLFAHYCGALDWDGIAGSATNLVDPPIDANKIHVWPIGGGKYEGIFSILQPGYAQAHNIFLLKNIMPAQPIAITAATAVCLALLLGCTGKSAQIPLYVWLPDAMAGPTPVSALIHAATMVTAGVYLVCRLSFVFVLSPYAMTVMAIIGAATALLAATIALVQNDIKKVLAYSTVSQLGFMFLGVGVGAFAAGFFHVFTHAFFKACLFLAAGSVIHGMHARIHDTDRSQDMRNMGGMRKYMPYTYWTFLAATLAIIGTPLLSGFFSKDEILYHAYGNQIASPLTEKLTRAHDPPYVAPANLGTWLYWIGIAAATMTAFYMCRALFLTFWGKFRGWELGRPSMLAKQEAAAKEAAHAHEDGDEHEDAEHHHDEDLTVPGYAPHESAWQMTVPLIVLATGAVVAGIFNMGPLHFTPLEHWLEPVFESAAKDSITMKKGAEAMEVSLMLPGVLAWAIGSGIAYWVYVMKKGEPAKAAADAMPRVHRWAMNKWYVDEFYEWLVLGPVDSLADTMNWVDKTLVDGILARLTALLVSAFGTIFRAFQNGVVHVYAAVMVVGLAVMGWFFVAPHADIAQAPAPGSDVSLTSGTQPGGYMLYTFEWTQCEPDKKQWTELYDKATGDAKTEIVKNLRSQHDSCTAPGDKWSAIGTEGFTEQVEVKLHLEPDGDAVTEEKRPVRLRTKNVFSPSLRGLTAERVIYIPRPPKQTTLEVGQN